PSIWQRTVASMQRAKRIFRCHGALGAGAWPWHAGSGTPVLLAILRGRQAGQRLEQAPQIGRAADTSGW
ncbi:hypothetical protein J0A65_26265, partial [Bowmanella sp. Y57]